MPHIDQGFNLRVSSGQSLEEAKMQGFVAVSAVDFEAGAGYRFSVPVGHCIKFFWFHQLAHHDPGVGRQRRDPQIGSGLVDLPG